MAGISSKAAGKAENKYKFNSIAQITDLDLNTYEAFYRMNDQQIGRWWQIDPKAESFYALTPYNSMGNNPVKFNDPLGDIFDEASQDYVNNLKIQIAKRQSELEANRKSLKKEMADAKSGGDKDKLKSLRKDIKEINSMRKELNNANHEIDVMDKSDQMFIVRNFNGDDVFGKKADGVTTYTEDRKAVVIGFANGNYDALAHEFKHGYDYLKGERSFVKRNINLNDPLSYFPNDDNFGVLYDINDEVRAFKRSYVMNPIVWRAWFSDMSDVNSNNSNIMQSYSNYNIGATPKNTGNTNVPKNEVSYKTQAN